MPHGRPDIDTDGDLPDPIQWRDLKFQPDCVAATVRRRFWEGRTPGDVQVFNWPKDRHGWRPMATMDPFDQVAYRGLVGRNVNQSPLPLTRRLSSRAGSPPHRRTGGSNGTCADQGTARAWHSAVDPGVHEHARHLPGSGFNEEPPVRMPSRQVQGHRRVHRARDHPARGVTRSG